METKEIDGVLYELVPEEKKKSCRGCAFYGPNRSICTTLTDNCNKGFIYKEIDKPISTSNLKPFNLEEAKAGKPVCTRTGRRTRIVCFDFRDADEICCIIAAVDYGEAEKIHYYDLYGKYRGGDSSEYDLMMLPEKKEGWVNLYKSSVRSTKEEAIKYRNKCDDYIDTIKISWEE